MAVEHIPAVVSLRQTEWALYSSLTLPGGTCHIYLIQNLTIPSYKSYSGYDTLYLDLRGHTLTTSQSFVTPGEGQRFVLLDFTGGGFVKSGDASNSGTVTAKPCAF